MTWEKSSRGLVALFDAMAPREEDVTRKKMFGWPCCFVNGNLFWGLHKESMIFRLPESERAEFFKMKGAADFEPMPGRKMTGWTKLTGSRHHDQRKIGQWIVRSLEFARTFPAKPAKKR